MIFKINDNKLRITVCTNFGKLKMWLLNKE